MDKSEIKRQYKQKPPAMGIFQVKNLASGRIYIGRAMDLNGKLNSQKFQLKNMMHMNKELQKDFNELGADQFSFEVLDRLQPKESPDHDYGQELKELEEMWLDKLQPYAGKGYNRKKS
ncbi:MAG: GIY-YIG nuclease family protein [Acidobacteria bacterium]|jgi:nitrate/nitrite-specific signal transduction histidine kinase|nr:GIY-YIG nuclease family protein [Acidobacteriota bacterium]